jgi:S1-C subfamily serine protease
MNSSWLKNNWFKVAFLLLFLSLLVVSAIFTVKYQRSPVQDRSFAKPNIVYLTATSTQPTLTIDLPAMVQEWYPSVIRVDCYIKETDRDISTQSGSGFLMKQKGEIGVLTNKHVIIGEEGEFPELCTIKLANNENSYIVEGLTDETKNEIIVSDNLDWGYMRVRYPNTDFEKAAMEKRSFCTEKTTLGTSIIVMGYPSAGSDSDITITQGIISGYEGDYYITDAKIGLGNSGGLAIKNNKNSQTSCLVGIPSFARIGEVVNLGRILDIINIDADPLFNF